MDAAAGELPDQPGFHRTKKKLPLLGPLSCPLHMIQNPSKFRTGKISIDHQTGLLPKKIHQPAAFKLVAELGGPPALPHNGWADGLPCHFIPYNRRLPLVGNPNGGDILRLRSRLGHGLHRHPQLSGPDFIGIVLYPSRFWKILGKLLLGAADNPSFLIK